MTTYKCWADDPEYCAEIDQFDLHDSKSIAKKLRRIDRPRQQLIDAQNDLASLLAYCEERHGWTQLIEHLTKLPPP